MSLLEDALQLLRCVLEYFGMPQDMLVPVWESTLCGQYRSIVRMIGTNLPLTPYPRLHFQIPLQPIRSHGHVEVSVDAPAIPSLADVLWLDEDDGDRCARFRSFVPLRKPGRPQGFDTAAALPVQPALPVRRFQEERSAPLPGSEPEALRKIHALETELLKLRAQIALIVTTPPADDSHTSDPFTPCFSRLPAPVFTSTPLVAPPPPPPPPPLPPPLPPPPALAGSAPVSVSDMIRQRQTARIERSGVNKDTAGAHNASVAQVPSMLDVLKDLNQVKLRSVERSPGGTPVRKRRSKGTACSSDPASLIAAALKRKFAHKRREDSFDKENRSAEPSPFSSPDTPRVPQLTRRSRGRNHL